MPSLTQSTVVALIIFVAGLIYHAGQATQRLAQLEKWREEMRGDIATIKAGILETQRMVRDGD